MSDSWHPIIAVSAFPADAKLAVNVSGWHILIARIGNDFHAVNDRCTHQAARLSDGKIRRGAIMCARHGALFDLVNGRCVGRTYTDLRIFPVRVIDGIIEAAVPDEPPTMDQIPVPG